MSYLWRKWSPKSLNGLPNPAKYTQEWTTDIQSPKTVFRNAIWPFLSPKHFNLGDLLSLVLKSSGTQFIANNR